MDTPLESNMAFSRPFWVYDSPNFPWMVGYVFVPFPGELDGFGVWSPLYHDDPEVSLALVVACLGLFSHFAISNLLSKAEALRDGEAVSWLGSTHAVSYVGEWTST